MSLVWMDGFEGYGNTSTNPGEYLARRYAVSDTTYFSIVAGRVGGYAVKSVSGGYYLQTPALTTNSTLIASFGYQTDYALNNYGIVAFYDGTTQGITLNLTSTGDIQVVCGATVLATTSALGIEINVWYFIEFKCVCGSSGSFELRVNGTTVASGSGVNTQTGSDAYYDRVRFFGGPYANPCTDDFYVLDGSGTSNNNFLGNNKIVAILPSADAGPNAWTATGTPHAAQVNENPPDDDATYVQDSVSGDKELWDYASLSGIGTVQGIQISTDARLTDIGSIGLKTLAKSAGTESDDAGQAVTSTTYSTFMRIMATDPSGNPWTQTTLNAAQFGVGVE